MLTKNELTILATTFQNQKASSSSSFRIFKNFAHFEAVLNLNMVLCSGSYHYGFSTNFQTSKHTILTNNNLMIHIHILSFKNHHLHPLSWVSKPLLILKKHGYGFDSYLCTYVFSHQDYFIYLIDLSLELENDRKSTSTLGKLPHYN